jgi:hypothetical protein
MTPGKLTISISLPSSFFVFLTITYSLTQSVSQQTSTTYAFPLGISPGLGLVLVITLIPEKVKNLIPLFKIQLSSIKTAPFSSLFSLCSWMYIILGY